MKDSELRTFNNNRRKILDRHRYNQKFPLSAPY